MINVRISTNWGKWKVDTRRLIKSVALAVMTTIKTRTLDGIGYDGGAWQYSEAYTEWKRARGRSPGSRGDWLRLSGQLMGSGTASGKYRLESLTKTRGVIGFYGEHVPYGERFLLAKTKRKRSKLRKLNTPVKTRHKGNSSTKPLSNATLASYLNRKFRFFGINQAEADRITQDVQNELRGGILTKG